jgi:hypothetical protein
MKGVNTMRFRRWRAALGAVVVAAGVAAAGLVAVNSASADPIEDGGAAKIATHAITKLRRCIIPTSELRGCPSVPAYTFVARTCWSTELLCYEIRTSFGDCLYYDNTPPLSKIGYGSCSSTSLRYRWRIDELDSAGAVRLRPASHTSRCVVYDPSRISQYPYTFIEECSSRPASHARLRLLRV